MKTAIDKLNLLKEYWGTWRRVAIACDYTERNLMYIRACKDSNNPQASWAKIDIAYDKIKRRLNGSKKR